jgi:hypothetical protein
MHAAPGMHVALSCWQLSCAPRTHARPACTHTPRAAGQALHGWRHEFLRWASLRGQLLQRTVTGIMQYEAALQQLVLMQVGQELTAAAWREARLLGGLEKQVRGWGALMCAWLWHACKPCMQHTHGLPAVRSPHTLHLRCCRVWSSRRPGLTRWRTRLRCCSRRTSSPTSWQGACWRARVGSRSRRWWRLSMASLSPAARGVLMVVPPLPVSHPRAPPHTHTHSQVLGEMQLDGNVAKRWLAHGVRTLLAGAYPSLRVAYIDTENLGEPLPPSDAAALVPLDAATAAAVSRGAQLARAPNRRKGGKPPHLLRQYSVLLRWDAGVGGVKEMYRCVLVCWYVCVCLCVCVFFFCVFCVCVLGGGGGRVPARVLAAGDTTRLASRCIPAAAATCACTVHHVFHCLPRHWMSLPLPQGAPAHQPGHRPGRGCGRGQAGQPEHCLHLLPQVGQGPLGAALSCWWQHAAGVCDVMRAHTQAASARHRVCGVRTRLPHAACRLPPSACPRPPASTHSECIQTIDCNQDGFLLEALKLPNLLANFDLAHGRAVSTRGSPAAAAAGAQRAPQGPALVGFREWIFSADSGALAEFAAATERSFGTTVQRVMYNPGVVCVCVCVCVCCGVGAPATTSLLLLHATTPPSPPPFHARTHTRAQAAAASTTATPTCGTSSSQ